jgi:uncharacterized protein
VSDLAGRLRGLRSQAGVAKPVPRQSLPPDIRQLLSTRNRLGGTQRIASASDRIVHGIEIAPGLRFTETLCEWPAPPERLDVRFARIEADVERRHLLHFDTETTGLAGGTGTRAFMIGAADWVGSQLRLRQLTMTSLAAESAMLRHFAGWVGADTVLVSYNGKCYDAPLLATRYRLARMTNPLLGLMHVDLLHPVRRHWKGVWENCRLATAERQLLGVMREDDLPGSEAPAAWLGYLRGGSAVNLRRVAEHNAQDLRSLAGVMRYMEALGGMGSTKLSP